MSKVRWPKFLRLCSPHVSRGMSWQCTEQSRKKYIRKERKSRNVNCEHYTTRLSVLSIWMTCVFTRNIPLNPHIYLSRTINRTICFHNLLMITFYLFFFLGYIKHLLTTRFFRMLFILFQFYLNKKNSTYACIRLCYIIHHTYSCIIYDSLCSVSEVNERALVLLNGAIAINHTTVQKLNLYLNAFYCAYV